MQGLITLDFGNSNPHAGFFQKNQTTWELLKVCPLHELPLFVSQLEMSANNTSLVLAEVKAREDEITRLQEQGYLLTRVKDYWRGSRFAGMPVHYAQTLGEDRLIEAFYCYKKEKNPTLLINAGTFVTIDIINSSGFQGGYIAPGTKVYFDLFSQGERLRDVDLTTNVSFLLPSDTNQAIKNSYTAFAALAKKLIREHGIKKIILTGGEASLWADFFEEEKKSLVVETSPHLVHWALHYWMTTQIELL